MKHGSALYNNILSYYVRDLKYNVPIFCAYIISSKTSSTVRETGKLHLCAVAERVEALALHYSEFHVERYVAGSIPASGRRKVWAVFIEGEIQRFITIKT